MKSHVDNETETNKEIEKETKKETSSEGTVTKTKKSNKKKPGICTTNCQYDSVRRCAKALGFKDMNESDHWTVYWTDCSVSVERCTSMKNFQRINHFPGMSEICRKDLLSRNLTRMMKQYPKEYAFFPRTWVLPADQGDLLSYMKSRGKKAAFICKPQKGCQGKGIYITRKPIIKDKESDSKYIIQQYIDKPLLIDGFKFDLRVYVLVTSCDPLRIFVYKEGLARFATTPYTDLTNLNMSQHCMHLTNYSINKYSDTFIRDDEESGSKRKFSSIEKWFKENNHDYETLWKQTHDIIIKTLIAAHPIISHSYRTCFPSHINHSGCFEILGFDILLDRKLKPWILEVNHSPSFHTDSQLDKEIKEGLLYDALNMIHVKASDRTQAITDDKKRTQQRLTKSASKQTQADLAKRAEIQERKIQKILEDNEEWELKSCGGFTRIYPSLEKGADKEYAKYFDNTVSLLQTTASAKAREEASKAFRLNLEAKNEAFVKTSDRGEGEETKQRSKSNKITRIKSITKVKEDVDESKIQNINLAEEKERQRLMKLRHIQFRDLGGIDFVYRVFHCTRGTTQHTKLFETGEKPLYTISSQGVGINSEASRQAARQCTDLRCPYRNNDFRGRSSQEERVKLTSGRSLFYGLGRHRADSGPPPTLGPATVLRQKPFSFMSEFSSYSLNKRVNSFPNSKHYHTDERTYIPSTYFHP